MRLTEMLHSWGVWLIFPALLAYASETSGQDSPTPQPKLALDPIIVSAPKEGSMLSQQSVPNSSSTLTPNQLQSFQLTDVQELGRKFANLSIVEGGARSFNTIFGLRGLTTTQYFSESPIAVYWNDIPLGKGFTQSIQLQQIGSAVLERGPQGSFYGQNSEAGVLLLKSKPSTKMETEASASYGNYNSQKYTASFTKPFPRENFSLGISGYHDQRDGFLFNETLGTHPDSQNSLGGNIHLHWRPSQEWDFSLLSMQEHSEDGEQRISSLQGDPFRVAHPADGVTHANGNTTGFKAAHIGENLEVDSITSFRWWKLDPYRVNFGFPPMAPLLQTILIDQQAVNQEFRISSLPSDGSQLDWSAGAFYSHEDSQFKFGQEFPAASLSSSANNMLADDIYAAFGHISIPLFEGLKLSLGTRLDYRRKQAESDGVTTTGMQIHDSGRDDFSNVTPQLGIGYNFDPSLLFYANVAEGFKTGGFVPFQGPSQLRRFETEKVWTADCGAKKSLLENQLFVNASFFYSWVENYQFERYISPVDYTVINAPEVGIIGGEFETLATPFPELECGLGLGYTSARFIRYSDPITGADHAGGRVPYVPEYNLNTHVQYKQRSGFLGRLEIQVVGETFFDEANTASLRQAPYGLMNGRIGYEMKHGGIYLFARNLTDKLYYGFKSGALNAGTIGEPRTFGVEGRVVF